MIFNQKTIVKLISLLNWSSDNHLKCVVLVSSNKICFDISPELMPSLASSACERMGLVWKLDKAAMFCKRSSQCHIYDTSERMIKLIQDFVLSSKSEDKRQKILQSACNNRQTLEDKKMTWEITYHKSCCFILGGGSKEQIQGVH